MNVPGKKVNCPSCNEAFLESKAYKFDIDHPRDSFTCPNCLQELGATLAGQSIKRFYTIGFAISTFTLIAVWFFTELIIKTMFGYTSFQMSYLIGMLASFGVYALYTEKRAPMLVIALK